MDKKNNINQTPEEKPFYKTKKGIIAIIGACCLGILVLGGIASLLTPDYVPLSESEENTTGSMRPEEAFIEEYDTDGNLALDEREFPLSKVVEINSKEEDGPYYSVEDMIEHYDMDQDHELSAYELISIDNLIL